MNFKKNESKTKLRGGYYTPPEIARFILKWVMSSSPQRLLEPSCGDGIFFSTLSDLGFGSIQSLVGVEIEAQEATKAQKVVNSFENIDTQIVADDFLSWALTQFSLSSSFDAIVGNPPFIRYQYLDKHLQAVAQDIFKYFNLNFTRHTNAWVPFIIASLALLKPSGRLGMVVPSELLHILYAEPLRKYLIEVCSRVQIIDPIELWFQDTLQGAVLLLAEKKEVPTDRSHGISIIQTYDKDFLFNNPERYFQEAHYANGETTKGKWMLGLLDENERNILQLIHQNPNIYKFDDIAKVAVGIVTGANKYFLVSDEVVQKYDLSKWSYPMFGRSDHIPGIVYDEQVIERNRQLGYPTNFIWFQDESLKNLPHHVQEYIQLGEDQNLHLRYKCSIREPWYSVPSVYSTSVGMLKRCHDFPRLIFNKVEAFTTDTAYRIKLDAIDEFSLVYSFVNSLTALTAELEGRHYGGGVLELVPSEIRKLLIPISQVTEYQVYRLDQLIQSEKANDILMQQDQILLKQAGLTNQMIEDVHNAWLKLKNRRHRHETSNAK